jgi:hypothetical protein
MSAGATLTNDRLAPDRRFCLTERDLELLAFVAAHRFVLACQVQVWLAAHEVVAYRRLKGLVRSGLLIYERLFHRRPGCYRVSGAGLAVIESELGRPTIDLRCYRHDVGVVWLWLAARRRHGARVQVLSERAMRSRDQHPDNAGGSFAIPIEGYAPSGKQRVHYPDVLVARRDGSSVAFELELSLKSRRRLEAILSGYRYERRIQQITYLTDNRVIAVAVSEQARLFGLDGRLVVLYLERASAGDDRWVWESLHAREVRL